MLYNTVGIQGILGAYQMCLSQVQLYGPTNFAPIIYHVAQFADAAKNDPTKKVVCNFALLLLTTCSFSTLMLYCVCIKTLAFVAQLFINPLYTVFEKKVVHLFLNIPLRLLA